MKNYFIIIIIIIILIVAVTFGYYLSRIEESQETEKPVRIIITNNTKKGSFLAFFEHSASLC